MLKCEPRGAGQYVQQCLNTSHATEGRLLGGRDNLGADLFKSMPIIWSGCNGRDNPPKKPKPQMAALAGFAQGVPNLGGGGKTAVRAPL
jgi:hypothetical protein